jgi:hypothetical protein
MRQLDSNDNSTPMRSERLLTTYPGKLTIYNSDSYGNIGQQMAGQLKANLSGSAYG